jgi:hypothetical protein
MHTLVCSQTGYEGGALKRRSAAYEGRPEGCNLKRFKLRLIVLSQASECKYFFIKNAENAENAEKPPPRENRENDFHVRAQKHALPFYRHRSALERSARLFYNIIKHRKPLENRRFSLRADRF